MKYEPVMFGEINDGLETQYPTTDVPHVGQHARFIFGQELDHRMEDQLPNHKCVQGTDTFGDKTTGVAWLDDGTTKLDGFYWPQLVTPHPTTKETDDLGLVVRLTYLGVKLSLISAHRPLATMTTQREEFDKNLLAVIKTERGMSRFPLIGIDTNEASPSALATKLNMHWVTPMSAYITGVFVPNQFAVLGKTNLVKTGEHAPVLVWVRLPLPV